MTNNTINLKQVKNNHVKKLITYVQTKANKAHAQFGGHLNHTTM